jgi:Mrp family chromosome partitioning ATPase
MLDTETRTHRTDVTLVGALREHLLVAALIVLAFSVGALVLLASRGESFTAQAVIVLEDPAVVDLLGAGATQSGDRFVSNQLAVLRSGVVATRAAEIVTADGIEVDPEDIAENAVFLSSRDSDEITITFESDSEESAIGVIEALIKAYREVLLEQRRAESVRVGERLSSAREVLLGDLAEVDFAIDQLRSNRRLDQLALISLDRLAATQAALAEATDPAVIAELESQIARIGDQIEVLLLAIRVEESDTDLATLLRTRDQIRARLDTLAQRSAELEVEAEAGASGIAFEDSPVLMAGLGGAGRLFTLASGAFLGLLVALGVVYQLAGRRATYMGRFEPNRVTGLRLLGDIPLFTDNIPLPVRDEPRAPGAEAIRFAVGNIQLALDRTGSNTVMFASTGVGEGKSTLITNVALASARSGGKVLVVDADFGNQHTSYLLLGAIGGKPGLTELAAGSLRLSEAVMEADAGMGVTIDVLSRGMLPVVAPEFFASRTLPAMIERISSAYDLVLIDGPPLLQVAYANNVARMAKAVVAVIAHGSDISKSQELVEQLRFMDVELLGYLYNKAPQRPEFLKSGGSMRDVLGDRGLASSSPSRTRGVDGSPDTPTKG